MHIRWIKFLASAALLAALLLAVAPWWARKAPVWLADFWRRQILVAPDVEAPRLIAELSNLGTPGLRTLVALVGSDRASVSSEAQRWIEAEIDRLVTLAPSDTTERVDAIVGALAIDIDQFGPAGRQFAENLVQRLLRRDAKGRRLISEAALPACERILQAAAVDHRSSRQARREPSAEEVTAVLAPFANVDLEPQRPRVLGQVEEIAPLEVAPPADEKPTVEANASDAARVVAAQPESDAMTLPETLDIDPDPMRELPELRHHGAGAARRPQLIQPLAAHGPAQPVVAEETRIIDWIRKLRSPDPRVVHEAEQQLATAGFDGGRLALARRLVSPDPAEREQLAEALPRIPGIDAKTWLLWLARDDRAEVRLAALSVMGTINDPELAQQIQLLARRDPDPRIQQTAERIRQMRQREDSLLRR